VNKECHRSILPPSQYPPSPLPPPGFLVPLKTCHPAMFACMRDHPIAKHPNWKDYDDGWL